MIENTRYIWLYLKYFKLHVYCNGFIFKFFFLMETLEHVLVFPRLKHTLVVWGVLDQGHWSHTLPPVAAGESNTTLMQEARQDSNEARMSSDQKSCLGFQLEWRTGGETSLVSDALNLCHVDLSCNDRVHHCFSDFETFSNTRLPITLMSGRS